MTVQIFTLGRINSSEDPDAAQDRLESWLEKTIPFYLESPEYQALSKANKKPEGSWFDFFMSLYMGYFGGNLKDVDVDAAQEIMEDLTPRKMICPGSQAKTIVPELIAFWSFLRRELGDKKLKHAASIIEYLTSIKKNYLKIYNRKPEVPDFLKELPMGDLGSFEDIMANLLRDDLSLLDDEADNTGWIEHFIQGASETLTADGNGKQALDQWFQLDDPEKIADLLEYICQGNVDESIPNRDEVMHSLLSFVFENMFTSIRQQDSEALSSWKLMEQEFIDANEQGLMDPDVSDIIFSVLSGFRQFLSKDFLEFIRSRKQNRIAGSMDNTPPAMEDVTQMLAAFFEEVPDEFVCATVLKEQLGLIPPGDLTVFFETMLQSRREEAADVLALWVLDGEQALAETVAGILLAHTHLISSKTLGRLVRIRNWLSQPVQKSVDQLIKKVRKSGKAPENILFEGDIMDVYMSAVDDSGAQGVMILIRHDFNYQLAGFVLKGNVGVVDAWVSPFGMKKEMMEVIKEARKQQVTIERVSLDTLKQQLPIFLALNSFSGIAVEHELIQIMENTGLDNWNPERREFWSLLPEALQVVPADDEVNRVHDRTMRWAGTPVGSIWFDKEDIGDSRDCRQEHLARMALWLDGAKNKKRNKQSRDFAVASWLLGQGRTVAGIERMKSIARRDHLVF